MRTRHLLCGLLILMFASGCQSVGHKPTGETHRWAAYRIDLGESVLEFSRDKMGWTTDIAKQFAGVLANTKHPMQWVAHSQGGAIFSEAMRYNLGKGIADMSNFSVAFHAGANNRWVTGQYAARAGVGIIGYYDAPNDLVPQIVGLRAWNRPDRLLWSIYSAPSLFGDKSPHTYPYKPGQ